MARSRITQELIEAGAIAVLRMDDAARLLPVAEAVFEGGVTALEVTMTVPGALAMIEALAARFGADALVGVGSVLDASTAEQAIEAGARFVVSPILNEEVIAATHRHDLPALAGAFSPTEAQRAHELGADLIKVFPADVLGMAFFKAVLAPMPHLKLMPTGGVTLDNAGDWIRAGACAVGVGSALLDKEAVARGEYEVLTENARVLRRSLAAGRVRIP